METRRRFVSRVAALVASLAGTCGWTKRLLAHNVDERSVWRFTVDRNSNSVDCYDRIGWDKVPMRSVREGDYIILDDISGPRHPMIWRVIEGYHKMPNVKYAPIRSGVVAYAVEGGASVEAYPGGPVIDLYAFR